MTHFTIKTHRPGTIYNRPHFFILNKGLNCGKPLKEPCPNCFVIQFSKESVLENYFWITLGLWQSKFWHQYLIGSAIPFFQIDEFTKEFNRISHRMSYDYARHQNQIKALRILEEREWELIENIKLIKQMRKIIMIWYIKKY